MNNSIIGKMETTNNYNVYNIHMYMIWSVFQSKLYSD